MFPGHVDGRSLLKDLGIRLEALNHLKFDDAKSKLEQNEDAYFAEAVTLIDSAIKNLYGDQEVSLQRLAATFRRGDLLEELKNQD